ncbi:zinc finger MYM-type protein 1-like [Macrobrachium nipponense]|uniref:zinc finger MYM-type protein 1-like n=1 Tax=Macrobrachium nipponense TaxID=159736 RepID=UPI0030C7DB49
MGALVNTPFSKWHHKSEVFGKHATEPSHIRVLQDTQHFTSSLESPGSTITATINKQRAANIAENKHILKSLAETVLYCGRQCIGLRGDNEMPDNGNPGNFVALLRVIANHDTILKQHLEKPEMFSATYISPRVPNEMIEVTGKRTIQNKIVKEVREDKFFPVMADEVSSYNNELMPLYIRFVDRKYNIARIKHPNRRLQRTRI